MSAVGKHLGNGLEVTTERTVSQLLREGSRWRLVADTGADLGVFDAVLAAVPSPQAHVLLAPVAPALAGQVGAAIMYPAWATLLVLADRTAVHWDGAFLPNDSVLSWVCRDASKPSRSKDETWVLHASREWSAAHPEADPNAISLAMTASFERLVGAVTPVHRVAHRVLDIWVILPANPPVRPNDARQCRTDINCNRFCLRACDRGQNLLGDAPGRAGEVVAAHAFWHVVAGPLFDDLFADFLYASQILALGEPPRAKLLDCLGNERSEPFVENRIFVHPLRNCARGRAGNRIGDRSRAARRVHNSGLEGVLVEDVHRRHDLDDPIRVNVAIEQFSNASFMLANILVRQAIRIAMADSTTLASFAGS